MSTYAERLCEWCALPLDPGAGSTAKYHPACKRRARTARDARKRNATVTERGGLRVKDATADIIIFVTADDVACATPGDPTECFLAKAVKRAVGHPDAAAEIDRTVAYVKMRSEDGEWLWERFVNPAKTRRMIEEFDRTGVADPAGYRLQAVPKWRTLGSMRAAEHHSRARRNAGTQQQRRKTENRRAGETVRLPDTVRNASGQVHHRIVSL